VKNGFATAKWVGSNVGTAHGLRNKRVPIGSVPLGDSCSVGQFRAASIFSMHAASPTDVVGSSLREIFLRSLAPFDGSARFLCPAPFAGPNEILGSRSQ